MKAVIIHSKTILGSNLLSLKYFVFALHDSILTAEKYSDLLLRQMKYDVSKL